MSSGGGDAAIAAASAVVLDNAESTRSFNIHSKIGWVRMQGRGGAKRAQNEATRCVQRVAKMLGVPIYDN